MNGPLFVHHTRGEELASLKAKYISILLSEPKTRCDTRPTGHAHSHALIGLGYT